jgi:hypothetical protein
LSIRISGPDPQRPSVISFLLIFASPVLSPQRPHSRSDGRSVTELERLRDPLELTYDAIKKLVLAGLTDRVVLTPNP